MWSAVLAIEDMMVVSDIGEQWSPNTAPDRIEAMLDRRMDCCSARDMSLSCVIWITSGMARGVKIVIVPHEVPVEKLTAAATRKISPGSISGAITPESRPTM